MGWNLEGLTWMIDISTLQSVGSKATGWNMEGLTWITMLHGIGAAVGFLSLPIGSYLIEANTLRVQLGIVAADLLSLPIEWYLCEANTLREQLGTDAAAVIFYHTLFATVRCHSQDICALCGLGLRHH